MARRATVVHLTPEDETTLTGWVRASTTEQRMVLRAKIVLLAAASTPTEEIASALQQRPATVSKWRKRFAGGGIPALQDEPRPGRPRQYTPQDELRILHLLDQAPPKGYAEWNGRLLARALGDVSADYVWQVLRTCGISLHQRHSWCISTDPEFAAKAADVTGLYLDPPENAIVICVDEKPHMQALERAQGYLRLPSGLAITGFSHEYKRQGTTTLFAALEVATGLVSAGHYRRRRRREFLDFMNEVVRSYGPQVQLHVILDNLNTHKPKRERWLARHPNVHFHYTPTRASWLNQIEIWFSILSRQALKGRSFHSPRELRRAIDDFIQVHNDDAAPFEWKKAVVHQKPLANSYADLYK
jgi:transposase